MKFGPVPPTKLPEQDHTKILQLAERWQRASHAHDRWATPAKECVNFFHGRQYTEEQLAELRRLRRPNLKYNVIAPLVRLVIGYHSNNKTDITFKAQDTRADAEAVAEALQKIEKWIANYSQLEFVDPEVFLDGLLSGRGWFDTRLEWEDNDYGEVKTTSLDPFSVKVDPDADTYDVNESAGFMMVDKWVSVDEIEAAFGKKVAELMRPFTMGRTPVAPVQSIILNDDAAPIRYFGQRDDGPGDYWDNFYALSGDFVDTARKTIRMTEIQHKISEMRNVLIDLETGDKKVLPKDWGPDQIQKALDYGVRMNNPLEVQKRMVESIQWTTMCADVLLYDSPSMYNGYTMSGYFPLFQRGVTRGMVEDLIDPQREKNKMHNNRTEIQSKTANGGWLTHQDALDPVQKARLHKLGSTPGVNIEWKGTIPPEPIRASTPNASYEKLEMQNDNDLRRISGINESALGEQDESGMSGKAIEARQRQAVVSVKMYMDNFRRTKALVGARHLDVIQNYYIEPRIYRVIGDDGKLGQVEINKMLADPVSGGKRMLNDLTVGKYSVVIDETPINATFQAAQFEEMMELLEKFGPVLQQTMPQFADLIIGMSSMPRKQEWIARLGQLGIVPPPQGMLPAPGAPPGPPGAPPPQGGQPAPVPGQPAPPAAPVPVPGPPQAAPPPQGVPPQGLPPNVVPMPVRA